MRLAGRDEVGDPAGQDARLARAGAGDDEERPLAVLDGAPLRRVEALQKTLDRVLRRG